MSISVGSVNGLFAEIAEAINERLNVTDYRTLTATRRLSATAFSVLDGENFVRTVFERLSRNWDVISRGAPRSPSAENFRWHKPKLSIADDNRSAEVSLERAFAQACSNARRSDWSNQVPVISGIAGPRAFKRFAIDLVRRHDSKSFEFVELKLKSDTPLYAAVEILLYGLLWLLSRRDQERLEYLGNPIIAASAIQLSILAPLEFYADLKSADFFRAFDAGISTLGMQHNVQMGFRATTFPNNFVWPGTHKEEDILRAFDNRGVL